MKKLKICFTTMDCPPNYLGGYVLYHKNLIKCIKSNYKNIEISWVYFGGKNKTFTNEGIKYYELKTNKLKSFLQLGNHFQLTQFFNKNNFDIINLDGGPWTFFYKKKKNQKIIHTLHGTIYYFNKNHLKRFNFLLRALYSPFLIINWLQEKPHKNADKLICVSEKVKKQVEKLYGKRKNIVVIRTGVDLNIFKKRNKKNLRKKLGLNKNNIYGLYVGRGGYWTKGLDRAVNLSEEIYKINKNFRLLVIGPNYKQVKHLLDKKSVIYLQNIPREKMPNYYSAPDMFFCMSRYEGGAPTLVVSEAMASGCLVVCSKDSKQEIVEDKKNAIIIGSFDEKGAKKILSVYNNKSLKDKIIKNSMKKIKDLSLENWGREYLEMLLN